MIWNQRGKARSRSKGAGPSRRRTVTGEGTRDFTEEEWTIPAGIELTNDSGGKGKEKEENVLWTDGGRGGGGGIQQLVGGKKETITDYFFLLTKRGEKKFLAGPPRAEGGEKKWELWK